MFLSLLEYLKGLFSRHLRLIVTVSTVALVYNFATYEPTLLYETQQRFHVGHKPYESTTENQEEAYFQWVESEYAVAAIRDWIDGTTFAESVAQRMQSYGYDEYDFKKVDQDMDPSHRRSQLIVRFVGDSEEKVEQFAIAFREELLDVSKEINTIPQFQLVSPVILPSDTSVLIEQVESEALQSFAIPLTILTAILYGPIVAAVFDYLSPVMSYKRDWDSLDIDILGKIPKG